MTEVDSQSPKSTRSNPASNVSNAIKQADTEIRKKYPFLNYQDTCGSVIFFGSLIAIAGCWVYYFKNPSSYAHCSLVIILVAFFTSFLHELEHDLIHNLYFKKYPFIQDIMFFFIWISKLHGNPWYRREMHLKHHIVSGQLDDAEERLIGLGIPFGWRRLAVSMHPFGMLIAMNDVSKDSTWLNVQKMNLSSAPVAFILFFLTKIYMVYLGAMWYFEDRWIEYLPERHWWWIRAANVCICLPNLIRQACIQTMSNTSHYYGDVPEKSVFYQNQILDHWMLYPYQFLCMNFGIDINSYLSPPSLISCSLIGATHIVHHYIPGQPFYIREMVYRRVKNYMVEQGVRINDFGTLLRSNHYFNKPLPGGKEFSALSKDEKEIAPNNSQVGIMAIWLGIEMTFGVLTYAIYDQWAFGCMMQRIFHRYIAGTVDAANKQKVT
jgi:hypothetical protein